jgi:hypothetical protein
VADELRDLLDAPLDELPHGDWQRHKERYRDFDRGATPSRRITSTDRSTLPVERTPRHTKKAWREWVLDGGIGDGTLAIVLAHEVEYEGFGWVYE